MRVVNNNYINQILCRLGFHKYKQVDTVCHYDIETEMYTITETCCRCGKQSSFDFRIEFQARGIYNNDREKV